MQWRGVTVTVMMMIFVQLAHCMVHHHHHHEECHGRTVALLLLIAAAFDDDHCWASPVPIHPARMDNVSDACHLNPPGNSPKEYYYYYYLIGNNRPYHMHVLETIQMHVP